MLPYKLHDLVDRITAPKQKTLPHESATIEYGVVYTTYSVTHYAVRNNISVTLYDIV